MIERQHGWLASTVGAFAARKRRSNADSPPTRAGVDGAGGTDAGSPASRSIDAGCRGCSGSLLAWRSEPSGKR